MKVLKITFLVVIILLFLFGFLFSIYLYKHRQGVIETTEIKKEEAKYKILIGSQGSVFKNALLDTLKNEIIKNNVNLKIVDVTKLKDENPEDCDAIILIHTTEKWQLQPDVKKFLDRTKDLNKVMLITTSGDGKWKTKDYNVDIITSASEFTEIPVIKEKVIKFIEVRFPK